MKINWKVRFKNPIWWVGLFGVICTAAGVSPEMLTNWGILWDNLVALVENPFLLGSVVVAVIGYNTDHTTAGFQDSSQAMGYDCPRRDREVLK